MYRSLIQHCPNFHLYIFPFDTVAYEVLSELRLDKVTLVPLSEFETPELLKVKKSRTKAEYCWTSTSFTIKHCLSEFNLPHCTYIDADLCFYDNPELLLNEMGNNKILITEHRYTPRYDQSKESGKYCVQFITFHNSEYGEQALTWWAHRCLEWCHAYFEDGKFGDQKYLDDWPDRFRDVHVLQHLGGGVAPWNVQQYKLIQKDGTWFLRLRNETKLYPLVFFHFHYVKFFDDNTLNLADQYDLGFPEVIDLYREYVAELVQVDTELREKFKVVSGKQRKPKHSSLYVISKRVYNYYQKMRGVYKNLNVTSFIKGGIS